MARSKITWGTCPVCKGSGLRVTGVRTQTVTQCKKCAGVGRTVIKPKRKKVEPTVPPAPDLQEEQDLRDHLEGLS